MGICDSWKKLRAQKLLDRAARKGKASIQAPLPRWLVEAKRHVGLKEIPGPRHNSTILKWWRMIKSPWLKTDDSDSPWCAGFVGGCLEEVGIVSSRSARARSYESWGTGLPGPVYGCVVTFWRGKPTGRSGHVAFVVGQTPDGYLMCLGGNQGDAVSTAKFSKSRVTSYRWPEGEPPTKIGLPTISGNGPLSTNEA